MRSCRRAEARHYKPHDQEAPQHLRLLPQVDDRYQVPGFVNSHSHALQRALRGRGASHGAMRTIDAPAQLLGIQAALAITASANGHDLSRCVHIFSLLVNLLPSIGTMYQSSLSQSA